MLPSYFISSSNTDPPLSLHTANTGLSVNYKTNTHTWCENFLYRISETKMIHLVHLSSAAWYNHACTCTWKRRANFHWKKKSKLKDSSIDSAIDIQSQGMLMKFIYLDMKDSWARGVGICYCPQKFTIG